MTDWKPWLRKLAAQGGKGVVNNIDARCLGRLADDLEHMERIIANLRARSPIPKPAEQRAS